MLPREILSFRSSEVAGIEIPFYYFSHNFAEFCIMKLVVISRRSGYFWCIKIQKIFYPLFIFSSFLAALNRRANHSEKVWEILEIS